MKKAILYIIGIIILILLLPVIIGTLLILLFIELLYFPFRNAKYKKSCFYRDFGLKYSSDYYCSDWYDIYNVIRAHELPIRCIPSYNDQGKLLWVDFTYGDRLLEASLPELIYDHDIEALCFADETDSRETIHTPVHQYAQELLVKWNAKAANEDHCREVVFLVTESDFISPTDLPFAKETDCFLFYDPKNIANVLQKFVSEN